MDGTTLVIITHEPGVAAVAGRRIEVLDGRVVADRAAGTGEGAREGVLS
jgi:macrolide transport system ATP-binding/permease protein